MFDYNKGLEIIVDKGLLVSEGKYTAFAIESYSGLVTKRPTFNNKNGNESRIAFCRTLINSKFQQACLRGVLNGVFNSGKFENETLNASLFCLQGSLSSEEKDACAMDLFNLAQTTYKKNAILKTCALLLNKISSIKPVCFETIPILKILFNFQNTFSSLILN